MPERVFYFVVVSTLFFNVEIFSQQKTSECTKLPISWHSNAGFEGGKQVTPAWAPKDRLPMLKWTSHDSVNLMPHRIPFVLSPSYYSTHLSVICNTELKLEKLTPVAMRFRLGSLEYVNYLERKPNALKPF